MLGQRLWHISASDQEAQFHVQNHGILGQVGAGDQGGGIVGHSAFDVERAMPANGVNAPLLHRPDVDLGQIGNVFPKPLDRVGRDLAFAFFNGFQNQNGFQNSPVVFMAYFPAKNGIRPCWKVCTSVVRSKYLLPCSQDVSGENRQAWQAAPCRESPSRHG